MMRNFDEFIDYNGVINLIEKLRLYLELEEQIISNIKKSLLTINDCYDSDNKKILNKINDNICDSLDIMYNNKEKYIDYLVNIVKIFADNDEKSLAFKNYDIS